MKHTFFINIEGDDLALTKLSHIFENYTVEFDDGNASNFNVMVNAKYLDPLDLDEQLTKVLELIHNSDIKNGLFGVSKISLWLNTYNEGNPFSWSFLNTDIMKALSSLDVSIELEFYPAELTMK